MLQRLAFKIFDVILKECAPWQLAGGLVLGFSIGTGIPFTLQWLIAVATAISLRIHLPTFVIGCGIGLPLGELLIPFFHRLGQPILLGGTIPDGLLAELYHAPLISFSMFHNTVVMGHTITMFFLLPVLFALTLLLLKRYHYRLFNRVFGSTTWLQFTRSSIYREYLTRTRSHRTELVRWRAIYVLPGLVAAAGLYGAFLLEDHLKIYFGTAASRFHGGPVTIAELNIEWRKPALELLQVEIGEPGETPKNLVSFDRVYVELAPGSLIRRKLTIPHLSIEGIRHGTARAITYDAPVDIPQTAIGNTLFDRVATGVYTGIRKDLDHNPLKFLSRIATAIDLPTHFTSISYKLASEAKTNELRTTIGEAEKAWKKQLTALPDPSALENLSQLVRGLASQSRSPATRSLGQRDRAGVTTRISTSLTESRAMLEKITLELRALEGQLDEVDALIDRDVLGARRELGIPAVDEDITKVLFGPEFISLLERLTYWVDWTRRHMTKGSPKRTIEAQWGGQSVHFAKTGSFPWLYVGKASLTSQQAEGRSGRVSGGAQGFNSSPSIWREPLRVEISADFPQSHIHGLEFSAAVDHTGSENREVINLKVASFPISPWSVHTTSYLSLVLLKAKAQLTASAKFDEQALDAKWELKLDDVQYRATSQHKRFEEQINKSLSAMPSYTLTGSVEGPYDRSVFKLSSEIGKKLAGDLRDAFRHEIGAMEDSLKRFIIDRVEPQREILRDRVAQLRREVLEPVRRTTKSLQGLQDLADKKLGKH